MQTYSAETKAKVIAEWKAGASQNQLVSVFAVPRTTIQRWTSGMTRALKTKETTEDYDLDAMAWKLVNGSFNALHAVHRVAEDATWLQRQNAADLAIFYGVITDKLIRLLSAVQRRPDDGQQAALNTAGTQ